MMHVVPRWRFLIAQIRSANVVRVIEGPPLTPRKRPGQARSRFTVDALLTATMQLLVRGGVGAVNTNDVAERAGVSVGSLYQYFPNKESLLSALAVRCRQELCDALSDVVAAERDRSTADFTDAIAAALVQFYREDLRLYAQLLPLIGPLGLKRKLKPVDDALQGLWVNEFDARLDIPIEESRFRATLLTSMLDATFSKLVSHDRLLHDARLTNRLVHVLNSFFE